MVTALKDFAVTPGGLFALTLAVIAGVVGFVRVAVMFGWITVAGSKGPEIVTYQDVVRHCGTEQASLKADIREIINVAMLPISETLARGDKRFDKIDDKLDSFGERIARVETSVEALKKNG